MRYVPSRPQSAHMVMDAEGSGSGEAAGPGAIDFQNASAPRRARTSRASSPGSPNTGPK